MKNTRILLVGWGSLGVLGAGMLLLANCTHKEEAILSPVQHDSIPVCDTIYDKIYCPDPPLPAPPTSARDGPPPDIGLGLDATTLQWLEYKGSLDFKAVASSLTWAARDSPLSAKCQGIPAQGYGPCKPVPHTKE